MRTGHDHSIKAAWQGLTPQSRIFPHRLRYLLRSPFEYTACRTNWVVYCYGLKLATGCAGSGTSLKGFLLRSAAVYNHWGYLVGATK